MDEDEEGDGTGFLGQFGHLVVGDVEGADGRVGEAGVGDVVLAEGGVFLEEAWFGDGGVWGVLVDVRS